MFPIKINAVEMSRHGTYLAGRAAAQNVRRTFEPYVADHDTIIDFTSVEAMTYPYADELLGNLYANLPTLESDATMIVLHGLNDETRETIAATLRLRTLLAVETGRHAPRLLAGTGLLRDTYDHAATLGTFRASDLALRLETSLANTNNKLKRLLAGRTLRRALDPSPPVGGKEYIYTAPR